MLLIGRVAIERTASNFLDDHSGSRGISFFGNCGNSMVFDVSGIPENEGASKSAHIFKPGI